LFSGAVSVAICIFLYIVFFYLLNIKLYG
jgi:hypothetical protein